MKNHATPAAQQNARALRTRMTDGERRLWSRLRREQLGVKFRRQHPTGAYVLDFACLDPKVAVEIDGSQHLEQLVYDAQRTAWLQARGFVVLRFWAHEVLSETDAVVTAIIQSLGSVAGAAPTPALPRRGREPHKEISP